MGFLTKNCCLCGKKASSLLSTKTRDGMYICGECAQDLSAPMEQGEMKLNARYEITDLMSENIEVLYERRKKEHEMSAAFRCTESIGTHFHVDQDQGVVALMDKTWLTKRGKIYGHDPIILHFYEYTLLSIASGQVESRRTLTGKTLTAIPLYVVMGLDHPIFDLAVVPLGVSTSEKTLFGKEENMNSGELGEKFERMGAISLVGLSAQLRNGNNASVFHFEERKKLAYRANQVGFLTDSELLSFLNQNK